jgi:uncharacterized protein (TIGR00290 family)
LKERVLVSWSGGKDSMMALQAILSEGRYEVAALLTTVTEPYGRISMHGVRRSLLERQAEALGLPLEQVAITAHPSNSNYETRMLAALEEWRNRDVQAAVFGDLFLEDIRHYRESLLANLGMRAVFPLWGQDSLALARNFTGQGFRAVITCVDTQTLAGSFAGRDYGEPFLADLPVGVDPCGENGEFHSFVYSGPLLQRNIAHRRGEHVLRDGRFMYCDLLPTETDMGR